MAAVLAPDPVLARFRDAVVAHYGPVLDRVVLFGSRARGEAAPGSDYDLAIFLTRMEDRAAEWDWLADLRIHFLERGGPFFEAIPFSASDYHRAFPLMDEIRRDGIVL
jgi:hypothetical protein